jgi:hypothetical protein
MCYSLQSEASRDLCDNVRRSSIPCLQSVLKLIFSLIHAVYFKYHLRRSKCSNLGLVRVSDLLDDEINCLGVDATYIYVAANKNIYAFRFGRKVRNSCIPIYSCMLRVI